MKLDQNIAICISGDAELSRAAQEVAFACDVIWGDLQDTYHVVGPNKTHITTKARDDGTAAITLMDYDSTKHHLAKDLDEWRARLEGDTPLQFWFKQHPDYIPGEEPDIT